MSYDKFIRCSCFIICLFCLLFSIFYSKGSEKTEKNDRITTKIVTVETLKVITDTLPIIKRVTVLESRYDTIPVIINDTDTITVPIEHKITQKIYSDDSTYTAYVSGCNSKLDSIQVYQKSITIDREIIREKKKKFGFTVGVGTQYDIINKTPTLGFGLMWGYRF